MRLTISSTTLASRLSALSKVFNSKNSMPILDCFLFEVNDNQLTITASDSENVMTTQLQLDESDGNGTFAVNNRTILDAVKELPEQPLTLDIEMSTFVIKVIYMNGMYNFTGQSGEEFPRLQPLDDGAAAITIESRTLANDISHSIFATANEELRPVMNGIYFDLRQDALAIVASDGHKLVRTLNKSIKSDTPMSFILPKKPATLLKNVLQKTDDDIIIRFDERNANIMFPEGTLACRLIEGRYPNYNSVIPQNNPFVISVDRVSLLNAVKRVSVFSSAGGMIKFDISENQLKLTAENLDFMKTAEETVACDYNGEEMAIGFNDEKLIEILSNINSDIVVVKLLDPTRAGIFVPDSQPEGEDVLMLLMPMML